MSSASSSDFRHALYTQEQRARRDSSPWTTVQAVLAPLQFALFLLSLALVVRYLRSGEGLVVAQLSVLAKTLALYAIMVTGSLWEKAVFGRYLFARPFFWEDVVSILVLVLHTGYVAALLLDWGSARAQLFLALVAYVAYVVNAGQYLIKLRAARRQRSPKPSASAVAVGLAK